jgi:hypothetical protein
MRLDRRTDDLLGGAVAVDVRGIDEVDAGCVRVVDDPPRLGRIGAVAERHRPDADRRNLDSGGAQPLVFH